MTHLPLDDARRIALAAQGFHRPRPSGPVDSGRVGRVIRQLGLLQLDFVNLVLPAHYQVLFSRLGPYPRSILDQLVYQSREFTEQWAHEASIIPVETWPLLRHRMQAHRPRPFGFAEVIEKHPEYVESILAQVRSRGPLTADVLSHPDGISRRLEHSWFGTVPRAVLEAYFGWGMIAVAGRRPDFSRLYDVAERIIPPEHYHRNVEPADARRELLRQAAKAYGVATAADLADYFRMPVREARPGIADLVESGEIRAVRVEGWREPAYLHDQADVPARIDAATLLSPFDPLIWYRPRAARLFGFEYRFEIFVPEEKLRWGRYVMPFLMGDRMVARVNLKAARAPRTLLAPAAFLEPGADPEVVADALARELRTFAAWLGLASVKTGRKGNLARSLAAALRSQA